MDVCFPGKKRYEGVWFNVISITRGWVGVKCPGEKRYVTLNTVILFSQEGNPLKHGTIYSNII